MKIALCATTDIGSLCDAVNQRYGWEMDDYDLCQLLFGEDYSNYCYKPYYFQEDEVYKGHSWQDEHLIDICNKVNRYLREVLPEEKRILIDVSW